jgi:hypothetical protein
VPLTWWALEDVRPTASVPNVEESARRTNELAFLEWDRHRLLRDARFLGIREDKEPHAVARE